MRRRSPLALARVRKLIARLGIRGPDEIDLPLILAHEGLALRPATLAGEEGRLLRRGRRGIVFIAHPCFATKKWRFVGAHELAHFDLDPPGMGLVSCALGDVGDGALGAEVTAAYEREMNDFAVELLLSEKWARPLCEQNRPSLAEIRHLARTFDVSLTMAALRMVELSPEACGLVYAERGRVVWSARNDDLRVHLLGAGEKVDPFTASAVRSPSRGLERVDADAWGAPRADVELWEEAILLDEWDATLTWLWHPPIA